MKRYADRAVTRCNCSRRARLNIATCVNVGGWVHVRKARAIESSVLPILPQAFWDRVLMMQTGYKRYRLNQKCASQSNDHKPYSSCQEVLQHRAGTAHQTRLLQRCSGACSLDLYIQLALCHNKFIMCVQLRFAAISICQAGSSAVGMRMH